jgi:hypothetical protein
MKPVSINDFDQIGTHAAAALIAFGAATMRSAAGTLKATADISNTNILGIAVDDNVEKTIPGFYSQYDAVPLITAGRCRLWVTGTHTTAEDIEAGAYLEIADLGGTNALPLGVFQQMGAEDGSATPTVREATTLARALEDVDLLDPVVVAAGLSVGGTEVTLSAGNMTALDLSDGDYILLEDLDGQCMINRVSSTTSTVITLQIASTVALANATDYVHKLAQCEAMLL